MTLTGGNLGPVKVEMRNASVVTVQRREREHVPWDTLRATKFRVGVVKTTQW